MWARLTKFFAENVVASAVSFTLLYLWLLVFLHGSAFTSPGNMADEIKLNIIGDSVGGLTAPLALIWLIAAVISQRQELNLTKSELEKTADAMNKQVQLMREQSELQRAVASANVQMTWFPERFALYHYFKTVSSGLFDGLSYEKLRDLDSHINKVRFVYGPEVFAQGKDFFALAKSMRLNVDFYENVIGGFPPIDEDGNFSVSFHNEEMEARANEILGQLHELSSALTNGKFISALERALDLEEQAVVSDTS
jgi:hypothetical protein